MKLILFLTSTLFTLHVSAQSIRYTSFSQSNFQKISIEQTQVNVTYNNFNPGLNAIANAIKGFTNSWDNAKKRQEEIQKSQFKIQQVKDTYRNVESYPETIQDGWHLVMVTDNYNFCNQAKALVENNNIVQLIVDNYIENELKFNKITSIRNAKSMLDLKDSNDNVTHSVEVYFTYDLEQPTIVDPPLQPGYISFYSDLDRAESVKIVFNGNNVGTLNTKLKEEDAFCFHPDAMSFKLKPTTYYYKAFGRGTINWKNQAVIKEGQCLMINLNEENKFKK